MITPCFFFFFFIVCSPFCWGTREHQSLAYREFSLRPEWCGKLIYFQTKYQYFDELIRSLLLRVNCSCNDMNQLRDSLWVFSEEIEDAKITAEKKRRSQDWSEDLKIDQNLRDQIEHSDIKLSKLVNTTENICYFWILAFDYIAILTTVSRVTTVAAHDAITRLKTTKIVHW